MSLGSSIAKARKEAGLSIDDLSAATNIRGPLIRQMESDDFSQCGGDTYARGHIRNIAVKLKVDPQIFLDLFDQEQMRIDRSMQSMLVETSVMSEPSQSRKVSRKALAAISVATLFVAGLVQVIVSNDSTPDIPVTIEESVSPTPTADATPLDSPESTPTQPVQPSDEATISTGQGVEVVITATRAKSWLFVSDASGRTLFSGQISVGVKKTFTSDQQLNLKVGNAGGVDLKVNGNEIESLGVDGQVVSVSYGVDS